MFYPQEMSEIEIVVPAKDILPVTKIIGGQGIFTQTDVNYLSNEKVLPQPTFWQEKASTYASLERRLQNIFSALEIHDGNPKDRDYGNLTDLVTAQADVDRIEREVKKTQDQINDESKKIEHFQGILQQIEPLTGIDVDFSQLRNSRYIHSVIGMMPPENIDRLKTSLSRIPFEFETMSQKGQKAVVWIAASRENEETLNRAVRSAYLDPINLPEDQTGTPLEISMQVKDEISASEKKIAELHAELEKVKQAKKDQLLSLLWDVRSSRMTANAVLKYGRLKYTYVIVGWVFSSGLASLKEQINKVSPETLVEAHVAKRTKSSQEIPVALNNPPWIRPFQSLVTTFSQPKYSEVDPTPIIFLIFPLLFGAMFGDVGHGFFIALAGALLMSKKIKSLKGMASFGPVLLACGIMAIIFGFLYGSLFGYEDILRPIWLNPGTNIMTILMITIAGGIVVLSLGITLNIYNMLKVKDWPNALFSHNGVIGLILYWALLGLIIPSLVPNFPIPGSIFVVMAAVGLVGIMFAEFFKHLMEGKRPLIEGGFGMFFVQAFFELFETVVSFLSNSLSFVRVGAFAVAHGALSAVFFMLAQMVSPSHGIGYWIMFLFGLIYIVGFEGLIVGIQTMRLTYYEIFGKFFNGGGKRFEPLTLQPAENEK